MPRDLGFPPAPEALPFAVYDNHTHFDIADRDEISADNGLSVEEQLERAEQEVSKDDGHE